MYTQIKIPLKKTNLLLRQTNLHLQYLINDFFLLCDKLRLFIFVLGSFTFQSYFTSFNLLF